MCEFHSLWNLPTAVRIGDALAEYNVYWSEDPVKMVDLDVLADYRSRVRIPVCASETLATRHAFRQLLAKNAVDYVMGRTETKTMPMATREKLSRTRGRLPKR